jgi:uncharacterized protein (DUF362 family)
MTCSVNRRDFLTRSAAAGLALGALQGAARGAPHPSAASARLGIARWEGPSGDGTDDTAIARKLTRAALDEAGGLGAYVSRGDVVWIKPNIAWNRGPQFAATTHPEVVRVLAEAAFEAGAKTVKIGDHTCHDARLCYKSSGIAAAAKQVGAEMVMLDPNRFRETKIGGERLDRWPVYPEIVESDLVINVPVVKHHGLSRVSLCMKNYMGVVGGRRGTWHQDLPTCLVDITAFMKPRLSVVDGVRALSDHGPTGGNLGDVIPTRVVAAGTDPVALDAFGAELLGVEPASVSTVRAGARAGLGVVDYQSLGPSVRTLS